MTAKKENRGGPRPGSGRPAKVKPDYDAKFKKDVLASIRRLEKKYDRKFLDAIFDRVFDPNTQASVVASILKAYGDIFTVKKSESETHQFQHAGPSIGLPPMRSDPALELVSGGKK